MGNPNRNLNRTQEKPTVSPETIPQFFKERNNWVGWRFKEVDGKQKKQPVDKAGYLISITDPRNFLTYRQAVDFYQQTNRWSGIGFTLTPRDGLCCIDIDNAFTEGGALKTQAWLALKTIGATYVERSPSGNGLHIWARATIDSGRKFTDLPEGVEVEVYGRDRYMTMTGNGYGCTGYPYHPQVEAKQAEIDALIAELDQHGRLGGRAEQRQERERTTTKDKTTAPGGEQQAGTTGGDRDAWRNVELDFDPPTIEDQDLIGKIAGRNPGSKAWNRFHRLYFEGDITGYPSPSEADMALLNDLAFWTKGDAKQMCRIFTASKLAARDKWLKRKDDDYAKRTIWKAVQDYWRRKAAKDFAEYESEYQPGGEQDGGRERNDGDRASTSGPNLTDTMRQAWEEQQRRQEQAQGEATKQKADAILANMQPASDRTEEPPPIKYIIKPQLSDDTGVAFLVGPGGGGKSFQALIRCIAIASGRPIGRAHQTQITAPAMFISLEDPPKVLQRRYYHTIAAIEETYGAFTTGQLAALDANLYRLPVRGLMGALMELDGKGNPRPTTDYHALREIVEQVRPAFVVLDTMSRALGVDENNNAHAAQWISALEQILFDYPDTIFQIVGHTGKPGGNAKEEKKGDPLDLRGASAFAWNARAVELYEKAGKDELKRLGLDGEAGDVFRLTLGKHNYTPELDPATVYFRRNENGVPIEIDTEELKNARDRQAYEDAIRAVPVIAKAWEAKDGPLNKVKWERRKGEDMTDPAKPKPGREQLAHDALIKMGIGFDQVATAIAEAISRGYVRAVEGERTAKTGPAPVVIVFDHMPPEEGGIVQ